MAKQKSERNEAIWRDLQAGIPRKEICRKYHLEIDGLKSLIGRIRERKGLADTSKQRKRAFAQVTSPTPQTSTSTKRMTFWLFKDTIEKIKAKATKEGKTSSEIARELFSKYLKGVKRR